MLLVQLKLSGVLDRHDAVLDRNESGQNVEERGLAGAGSPRDDDVGLGEHRGLQESETKFITRTETDQVFDLVGVA